MTQQPERPATPAVRRPDAYDQLGQSIAALQQALAQMWDAISMVEALDAGKAPSDAEIHAAALTHLTATCRDWQRAMAATRDGFLTWMLTVAQEQHEALSGKELLRELIDRAE